MLNLINPKGIALLLVAGYFLSKKKAADNASAEVLPAYLTPPSSEPLPVSLAVPVRTEAPSSVAPVSTKDVSTMPVTPPLSIAVNEPAPALPAPAATPVVVAEDPRIAKRIEIAKKYGADPSQLDLNQPEIEYWDATANLVRRQPNYIYKSNQLSLPTTPVAPVAAVSLFNTATSNQVKFGSSRRFR